MKYLFLFLSALISLGLVGCDQNRTNDVAEVPVAMEQSEDGEVNVAAPMPTEADDQAEESEQGTVKTEGTATTIDHPIRPGEHNFSLQWIGWEAPGKVQVEFLEEDQYKVTGEQRGTENEDFATIDGTLTFEGNRTFLFEGEIASRVSYINNGETCVKNGPLHFRATGSRKYWRLQEKDNCEGGRVVDYFDIYF